MLKKLKKWWDNYGQFSLSWYSKDRSQTQEPERSLIELPTETRHRLTEAVRQLSINPVDRKSVAYALDESFDNWRENPNNTNNSLVVVSSPVTAVARILAETVSQWAEERQLKMNLLPLTNRPYAIEDICSKLENFLQQPPEEPEIIVIPDLSWCFLRSLEGLEGIEYLQSLLCSGSKNRFWLIGTGQVGWEYLNSVCNLATYCGEIFALPEIPPEDLRSWLQPVVEEIDIEFDKPRIDQQLLDGDKDNETNYFESLADVAQGVSTISIQAFLGSIKYIKEDENYSEKIIAQTPKLPKLPTLEASDRYLLYSFLLHGQLTIPALVESLGDSQPEVQGRVQYLRREGLIEQQDNILQINPIHYIRIKRELALNNFVIGKAN